MISFTAVAIECTLQLSLSTSVVIGALVRI